MIVYTACAISHTFKSHLQVEERKHWTGRREESNSKFKAIFIRWGWVEARETSFVPICLLLSFPHRRFFACRDVRTNINIDKLRYRRSMCAVIKTLTKISKREFKQFSRDPCRLVGSSQVSRSIQIEVSPEAVNVFTKRAQKRNENKRKVERA